MFPVSFNVPYRNFFEMLWFVCVWVHICQCSDDEQVCFENDIAEVIIAESPLSFPLVSGLIVPSPSLCRSSFQSLPTSGNVQVKPKICVCGSACRTSCQRIETLTWKRNIFVFSCETCHFKKARINFHYTKWFLILGSLEELLWWCPWCLLLWLCLLLLESW